MYLFFLKKNKKKYLEQKYRGTGTCDTTVLVLNKYNSTLKWHFKIYFKIIMVLVQLYHSILVYCRKTCRCVSSRTDLDRKTLVYGCSRAAASSQRWPLHCTPVIVAAAEANCASCRHSLLHFNQPKPGHRAGSQKCRQPPSSPA